MTIHVNEYLLKLCPRHPPVKVVHLRTSFINLPTLVFGPEDLALMYVQQVAGSMSPSSKFNLGYTW